jgi:hypothetical protein
MLPEVAENINDDEMEKEKNQALTRAQMAQDLMDSANKQAENVNSAYYIFTTLINLNEQLTFDIFYSLLFFLSST